MQGHLKPCSDNAKCRKSRRYNLSWLPAIVIAILPKCPFCIMAYSGAVSMCAGSNYFPNADAYSGYFIVGLSLIILLGILLNKRGIRTWIAASLAGVGIILLSISQFVYLSESIYYLASFTLFFGIWFNGSFGYFYNKIILLTSNKYKSKLNL